MWVEASCDQNGGMVLLRAFKSHEATLIFKSKTDRMSVPLAHVDVEDLLAGNLDIEVTFKDVPSTKVFDGNIADIVSSVVFMKRAILDSSLWYEFESTRLREMFAPA